MITPLVILTTITLDFDPFLRVGGLAVPWRALAIAGAILLALCLAAFVAVRRGLRSDDLLFIAIGAIPGGVIGGRLVHALVFNEAYRADPLALFDPARGSLSLLGAVLGGTATAAFVTWRLEAPVGRWADTAAAPLLVAIGLGKLAELLGGAGQGTPSDLPWSVAFVSAGPWISVSPDVPAHPAQAYEGLWAILGIPLVLILLRRRGMRGTFGTGAVFAIALAWWLPGRVFAATTWRDAGLIGQIGREQLIAALSFACVGALLLVGAFGRHGRAAGSEPVTEAEALTQAEPLLKAAVEAVAKAEGEPLAQAEAEALAEAKAEVRAASSRSPPGG